jgi:hypothetical protein
MDSCHDASGGVRSAHISTAHIIPAPFRCRETDSPILMHAVLNHAIWVLNSRKEEMSRRRCPLLKLRNRSHIRWVR